MEESIGAVEESIGAVEESSDAMVEPRDWILSSDSTNPALRCSRCFVIHNPFLPTQYCSLSLSHYLKPTVFSFSMFNIFSKSCMCNQRLLMFELLCVAVRLFKRAKSDTIVLTGLSGSGKTVLFYQVSTAIFLFVFLKCVTLWRIW